jgi:hypothetical protein
MLGGALLSGHVRAQCVNDSDCQGERVCQAGRCAAFEALPPAPSTLADEPAAVVVPPAPAVAPRTPALAREHFFSEAEEEERQPMKRYRRRSVPVMVTGIGLAVAAPVLLFGGAVLSHDAYDRCRTRHYFSSGSPDDSSCDNAFDLRTDFIVGGAVLMVAGAIPMIIIGAHRVRNRMTPAGPITTWVTPQSFGLSFRGAF